MGYEVKPPEFVINQFGYIFLQQKDYERSAMFFQLNIDYYPQSFNAYDSMGDYYVAKGDRQKAIEAFNKSLSLKETQDTRQKLNELKK